MEPEQVFVTGSTATFGLAPAQLQRPRPPVHALARPGSEGKLPAGCVPTPWTSTWGCGRAARG